MIEDLRLGEVVGQGDTELRLRPQPRLPGRRAVPVHGGRRRCLHVPGQPARRVRVAHAARPVRRAPDEPVDLVVGDQGRQRRAPRQRERARRGQRERTSDRRLRVIPWWVPRRAATRHHEAHAVRRRRRPQRREHLGRHLQHLVDRLPRDLDLREPHCRRRQRRHRVVRRPVEGHPERMEAPKREGQGLSGRQVRRRREVVADAVLAVEGHCHPGHPARAVAPLWLRDRDVVGGDGVGELRLPPLALRIRNEGARDPRRVEIAVDGAVGLVLGRVGDAVAIAAGRDVHRADVRRVCLRRGPGPGEQLDRAVAQVGLRRVLVRRLGVARVRRQRVPAEGLLAVGVGHHELRALRRQLLEPGWLRGQCSGVVDRTVRVEQSQTGQVVQAGGVALHDHGAAVGLAAQQRPGVGHRVRHDRRGPAHVALHREVLLVQRRDRRIVRPRRPEGGRVGQSLRRLEELEREELGLGDAVVLVALVVLHHDVPRAHQAGHRRQRVPVGDAVLEGTVDGVQRVGRRDGSHHLLLARHEVAVQQRRLRGVDRVAPVVGGEVVARDGEDPGPRVRGVEVIDGGQLVGRQGRRLREVVGDGVAVEQGGDVGDDEARHAHRGGDAHEGEAAATARSAPSRAA